MKEKSINVVTSTSDTGHDITLLFCEDILKYQALGGNMQSINANAVYDKLANRTLLLPRDLSEEIRYVNNLLNSNSAKELDTLEKYLKSNFDILSFNIDEIQYLFYRTGIKVHITKKKRIINLTIQDKVKLYIEYLKINELIVNSIDRNELANNDEFKVLYEYYNNRLEDDING